MNANRADADVPALSPALTSRNPAAWLVVFGPGAIIASLTIGTGELVFSSRAGVLFGYEILWLFLITCVLKWALVFAAARHLVLSGAHPFERYMHLPGPRGWFPLLLAFMLVLAIPVWIGFLAGVLGTLPMHYLHDLGIDSHLWGVLAVVLVAALALRGGYTALERVQLLVVGALLVAVSLSMLILGPDWGDLLKGMSIPAALEYPPWLPRAYPEIAARPVWVETATYVGVIGGGAYDYLAYVSFVRQKSWGLSAGSIVEPDQLENLAEMSARGSGRTLRKWIRAPLIDCAVSFLVVLAFAAVFVASGKIVLAPREKIPDASNLLNLQEEFLTQLHPWLLPLYVAGALLALLGTIYGTLEVGPTIAVEALRALRGRASESSLGRARRWSVLWAAGGGLVVLAWSYAYTRAGEGRPPALVAIITPANLFTGVLACGLVCLLNPWMDRKFLPRSWRMARVLVGLNVVAGVFFLALGIKGYWDFAEKRFDAFGGGWLGLPIFVSTVAVGWIGAAWLSRRSMTRSR